MPSRPPLRTVPAEGHRPSPIVLFRGPSGRAHSDLSRFSFAAAARGSHTLARILPPWSSAHHQPNYIHTLQQQATSYNNTTTSQPSPVQPAQRTYVSHSWPRPLLARVRRRGSLTPRKPCAPKRSIWSSWALPLSAMILNVSTTSAQRNLSITRVRFGIALYYTLVSENAISNHRITRNAPFSPGGLA